jgi:hypothetical protein
MSRDTLSTFFSKAADPVAGVLLRAGFVGFFVCWGICWNSEQQVLGRPELRRASPTRTAAIEMKGVTWYVVPSLAHRYETANDLIGLFWVLGAAGGAIRERNRIAAWWKSRTTH